MTDTNPIDTTNSVLTPGQHLYDAEGREVGVIRAITDTGVEVTTRGDVETVSLKRALDTDVGEGYLVWRCATCGELGDLDEMPDRCPGCGANREELYAYLED
jgi:rubrerythrin